MWPRLVAGHRRHEVPAQYEFMEALLGLGGWVSKHFRTGRGAKIREG